MRNKRIGVSVAIAVVSVIMVLVAIVGMIGQFQDKVPDGDVISSGRTLEELMGRVTVQTADPVKAPVDLTDNSLYDELPEISKYPLGVESRANVVLEIFSSPEKAGESSNHESWLIDIANQFNKSGVVTSSGKTCGISVRSVSSGLAADYIISGKYVPELFTPSNALWSSYIESNGRTVTLEAERLVGNTAGVMVKKSFGFKTIDQVISGVVDGSFNLGYTNPQVSSAGMNMLLTILDTYGNGNMTSDAAIRGFASFQANIPYVAYNTNQMVRSAGTGVLDGMVVEYQGYVNNKDYVRDYDFIPYGIRHDNPLYSCRNLTADESECLEAFLEYALGSQAQSAATKDGFNANDSYVSAYSAPSGAVVGEAEHIWKLNKDSGKEIIAVFVADCSGSMGGAPMAQLKESLINGMQYINEDNYIGLVSYSSSVTKELDIAKFDLNQKSYFQGAVNRLSANGNTSTYEAICCAMSMVKEAQKDHPNAKCMIFLLSDGEANGHYRISDIQYAVQQEGYPIYTIGYGSSADTAELGRLSAINEAASIYTDTEDVVYQLKSLFNAQL